MKTCLLVFLAFASTSLLPGSLRAGDPRPPVEVTLVPDKTVVMAGEPFYITVTAKNNTAKDFPRPYQEITGPSQEPEMIGYLALTVTGTNGLAVKAPTEQWRDVIRPHAEYKNRVLMVINQPPGKYVINSESEFDAGEGASRLVVKASGKITVVPLDDAKMAALIVKFLRAQWVVRAVNAPYSPEPEEASSKMGAIRGGQYIPALVKAVHTPDPESRRVVMEALENYNNEAAFGALKECAHTTAAEIQSLASGIPGRAAAEQAAKIRALAVASLGRSKHPDAKHYILTLLHDPDYNVRLAVYLEAEAREVSPADALVILNELTRDSDINLRKWAKEDLGKLSAGQQFPSDIPEF